jgi:predicted hydrolase (HD superfamily)
MKRGLFGWTRLRLSQDEAAETAEARVRAEELAAVAEQFRAEAPAVGARQRQIRRENHFGLRLDSVYGEV